MKRNTTFIRMVLGTSVGLALAWLLLKQIKIDTFWTTFKRVSFPSILLAFAFYSLSTFFRACRWQRMILAKSISLFSVFCVTSIHNFLNQLLPARTGELSYIYLLRKTQGVCASQSTATLLLARVFDLLSMGIFFLISILFLWSEITVPRLKLFLITFFTIPLFLIIFLGLFSRRGVEFLRKIFSRLGLLKSSIFIKISDFLARLAQDLHQIRISRQFFSFAGLTFLGWGAKFLAFYVIVKSIIFSSTITFGETVLGTTFSELASTLPVYGFAGFGTIEGGWTLGFLLIGLKREEVIAGAFCFHILLLTFSMVLGLFGFIFLRFKKDEKND